MTCEPVYQRGGNEPAEFGAEGGIVSGGIAESLDRSGNPFSCPPIRVFSTCSALFHFVLLPPTLLLPLTP